MKIYTSYYGNLKKLMQRGIVPINISLYPPKWFRGNSIMYLAPRPFMLGKNVSEEYYTKIFNEQIMPAVNLQTLAKDIEARGQGKDVALLCYEKPGDFCHRHLVADWLNKKGIPVEEFAEVDEQPEQHGERTGFPL